MSRFELSILIDAVTSVRPQYVVQTGIVDHVASIVLTDIDTELKPSSIVCQTFLFLIILPKFLGYKQTVDRIFADMIIVNDFFTPCYGRIGYDTIFQMTCSKKICLIR